MGKIAEAAGCGVDFIQLREKDLLSRDLALLARDATRMIRENSPLVESNAKATTRLLINSRTDLAIAAGADGVHLRSVDISPRDVRLIWGQSGNSLKAPAIISIACHTLDDVALAAEHAADFAVFGPVFEKTTINTGSEVPTAAVVPVGETLLREACDQKIPLIALGGITVENAADCLNAGASGIAGIRIFQENNISQVVRELRDLASKTAY